MSASPATTPEAVGGLSRFLDLPGGVSFDQALRKAEELVDALRGRARARIGENLKRMAALLRDPPDRAVEDGRQPLMALSGEILSIAGLLDETALASAAQSCRALLEDLADWTPRAVQAVDLHHQAMRLLHARPGASTCEDEQVLEGLLKVARRALAGAP